MHMQSLVCALAMAAAVTLPETAAAARVAGVFDVWAFTGDAIGQRKDVQEVSLPRPPSGPATPIPYCTPAQPICP